MIFLVSFSSPYITFRCQNAGLHEIENLELEIVQLDLDLKYNSDGSHPSCHINGDRVYFSNNLLYESHFDANYHIGNYKSGYQSVKILATYTRNGSIKHCSNFSILIDLPKLWDIRRYDFHHNSSDLYSLEISPDFALGYIKTLSFGHDFDDPDLMENFDFVTSKLKSF